MILSRRDYEILTVLGETGGFLTRDVVRLVGDGMTNQRKKSALMYRQLYSLSTGGFIKEMDDKKPVCWTRTPAGTEALNRRAAQRGETR